MESDLKKAGLGYHYPTVYGEDINKVWTLRKAGLGVLSNIPGDAKPVSVIEDTSVNVEVLPDYIKEIKEEFKNIFKPCAKFSDKPPLFL